MDLRQRCPKYTKVILSSPTSLLTAIDDKLPFQKNTAIKGD